MGKNKSASNLVNVIDFNNDRIAFISGSTTLMSISSSGAITTTGVISGSNAQSASFALNAGLLNNRNSAEFTSTGSFNSYTSSNDATVTNVAAAAVSAVAGVNALAARTSSYTTTSSFNSYTASNNTTMSCVSSTATSALVGVGTLASQTGSYATTGSNTFVGGQYLSSSFNPTGFSTTASLYTDGGLRVTRDAYISGTLYLNNVTVFGTQSVAYISSSQLNIGTNLITVNTDTPSIRFGGLAVYDSGSTGLTGSLLWDSQNNHWVYSNPSGSSYSGGMFISGPRTSTLGSETGTTACMLLAGQGGDHLTSSMIYHDSTVTCIPGIITGGSDILLTAANPVVYGGTAVGGVSISNNTGASYIKIFGACHASTPNNIAFINANSTTLTVTNNGLLYLNTPSLRSTGYTTGQAGQIAAEFTNYGGAQWFTNVANDEGSYLVLGKSRGSAVSSNTVVQNGDTFGAVIFQGTDGTTTQNGAMIRAKVDGTPGSNDMPGRLEFYTTADGSTTLTERFRITSTGISCFYCPVQVVIPESTSNIVGFGVIGAVCGKSVFIGANCTYGYVQSHGSVPLYINELGNNVLINLNGGNTGIGISPVDKFHINGNVISEGCFFSGAPDNLRIFAGHWGTVSGNANCYLVFQAGGGSASFGTPQGWGGSASIYTCGQTRLTILTSGNVGINCTSPGYTLDVNGTTHFRADGSTMLVESTQPTNQSTLRVIQCATGGNGNTDQGFVVQTNAADGTSNIAHFYDFNNGSPLSRMVIKRNGNVGIGCTSPGKNLTVNGCIGMSNTYNWGITNDADTNWGFRVCSTGPNYSTFISYAGDQGSDRRGGIYNQNGHWVAYGNCMGHFIVQCNLNTLGTITAGSSLSVGSSISAGGSISGTLLTSTTQRLSNSTGNFANMVQKVFGAAGAFSCLVICVNLAGAGGYGYIINSGGTNGGVFQSGGGYINGPSNFSHSAPVGCGFVVSCHTCAGTDDVIRFVGAGGVHPFVSIQMFGSLNQFINDDSFYIAYF